MSVKLHWYCFTFYDVRGPEVSHATAYFGFERQTVTLPQIEEAKAGARVSQDATMLACSYLGYMTGDEFRNGF